MSTDNKDVASVAIFNLQGRVLALKRSDTVGSYKEHWNFPGGSVDEGEEPIDSAIREAYEEAGLSLDKDKVRYVSTVKINNLNVHYFVTVGAFDEVTINWESTEFSWVKVKDIPYMRFIPMSQDILKKIQIELENI